MKGPVTGALPMIWREEIVLAAGRSGTGSRPQHDYLVRRRGPAGRRLDRTPGARTWSPRSTMNERSGRAVDSNGKTIVCDNLDRTDGGPVR